MNKECIVIIDERTSLPVHVIKSKCTVKIDILKDHAKQWISEHNKCSWSCYYYVVIDIKDAPRIKSKYII